jgi:hypothetical protein
MAVGFVQTNNGGTGSASPNFSVTFSSTTTTGNLLVAAIATNDGLTLSSVVDSNGNSYSQAGKYGSGQQQIELWYCANSNGGASNKVTATCASSQQRWSMGVSEWSGVSTSSPLDVYNGQATEVFSGANLTTGSITTTATGDLLLAFVEATHVTTGVVSGYTNVFEDTSNDTTNADVRLDWNTAGSAGSYSAYWTQSGSSTYFAAVIAAFKAAGGTAYTISGTGGSVCGSDGSPAWSATAAPQGGGIAGSVAAALWSALSVSVGGVVSGSQAATSWSATAAPEGGSIVGSFSSEIWTATSTPYGGSVAGSDTSYSWLAAPQPDGGSIVGSLGSDTWMAAWSAFGGAVDSSYGSAGGQAYSAAGTGGSVDGSSGSSAWTVLPTPQGGVVAGSSSSYANESTWAGTGGSVVGSLVSTTWVAAWSPAGGSVAGSIVVFVVPPPATPTIRDTIIFVGTVRDTVQFVSVVTDTIAFT